MKIKNANTTQALMYNYIWLYNKLLYFAKHSWWQFQIFQLIIEDHHEQFLFYVTFYAIYVVFAPVVVAFMIHSCRWDTWILRRKGYSAKTSLQLIHGKENCKNEMSIRRTSAYCFVKFTICYCTVNMFWNLD